MSKRKRSKKYDGVYLYPMVNGDVTYSITYKHKDKLKWVKVGRKSQGINEIKCKEKRNTILSELRHGHDLSIGIKKKNMTLDFLAQKYFEFGQVHVKSINKYIAMYNNHVKALLGEVTLSQMSDNDILRIQRVTRDKGLSDSTNNSIVKLIKRIVSFGVKNSYFDYMPFKNIKLFKLNNSRDRYLTKREINKLFHFVHDEHARLFLHLALSTGARANAILNIKKQDIDFDNKSVLLNDDKGHTTYTGFLNNDVINYISDFYHKLESTDNIITQRKTPLKIGTLRYRLKKGFDQLNEGIATNDRKNRVVIHTLRHTFASHLAISGASITKIKKLLNHTDIKQTMRYAKLSPESGRDEIGRLYQ